MKRLSKKIRPLLRAVYRGLGVTAASLVFQACYGMPPDTGLKDHTIYGEVRAKDTNLPIPGIRVSAANLSALDETDNEGHFYLYVPQKDSYELTFEDLDGEANGGLFKQTSVRITLTGIDKKLTVTLEPSALQGENAD